MPPSLLEDIVFIVFFFSLFTVLMTSVPYIYQMLGIHKNDDLMIIVFWLSLFILFGFWLKYLQDKRYEEELKDARFISESDTIDGFVL